MKVIGINGSPRKGWNTDTLVKKALEGAEAAGAETELIDLYKINFKGCYECFACKRKGNNCNGLCAIKDDLRPILEKILAADALVVGSPNMFGYPSGIVRELVERLLYPSCSYEIKNGRMEGTSFPRILPTGVIFTMNADPEYFRTGGYEHTMGETTRTFQYIFGYAEQYNSYETLQFKDYSKMLAGMFDGQAREERHATVFPHDCEECFKLGERLVAKAMELNNR